MFLSWVVAAGFVVPLVVVDERLVKEFRQSFAGARATAVFADGSAVSSQYAYEADPFWGYALLRQAVVRVQSHGPDRQDLSHRTYITRDFAGDKKNCRSYH